jgi:uncharacterized protein YxjI
MKYLLKSKLFSIGSDFTIQDEAGNDAFFVDGKFISLRDELSFQDMKGNELAVIRRKLLSWGPTYEIYHQGQLVATVKQKMFTLLRNRFFVDVPGPDDIEAQGNFTDHEYVFTRGGQEIARVSKAWFTLRETYGVDVYNDADAPLILATTVVIERCSEDHQHHSGIGISP